MPPDPVRAADVRAWLAKAAQDLRRVDLLLAAEPPDPEGGLFHSQQAAEKALKAFLTWHDVPFRRVHELDELGAQCIGIDSSLAELMGRADALTKYAWRFRYPGAPYEPTLDEGWTAFDLAREVMDTIGLETSRLAFQTGPQEPWFQTTSPSRKSLILWRSLLGQRSRLALTPSAESSARPDTSVESQAKSEAKSG